MNESSTSYVVEMQYQPAEPGQQWFSVVANPDKDEAVAAYGRCTGKPAAVSGECLYRMVERVTTVTDRVILQYPAEAPQVPDIPMGGHFAGPDPNIVAAMQARADATGLE